MNRHRRDRRGDWLSPDAYDALSPEEKRAIWLERKHEPRRRQGGNRGRRSGGGTPWVGWAMVGVLVAGAAAWELSPASWFGRPVPTPSGETEVSATFEL